jgi:glycosyltransferase involved in cell wall biosynthesis
MSGGARRPAKVSVIIPCRNAARHLGAMLESLAGQELAAAWEVVVVDNGSTDGSRRIAEGFGNRLNLRIVDATERRNASYARNLGVQAASGDRLLFLDADDEIAPGYLQAMNAALESHEYVASRVDSSTLNPEWVRAAHGEPWQVDGVAVFFGFMPATGINVGLRRSIFQRAGGFPEQYPGSQDIAFSWKVQLGGTSIAFVPEAVYRYRHRDTLRGLYRQCVVWGSSNVLLYREFRSSGMPRRSLPASLAEWRAVLGGLLRARGKAEQAPLIVRLGYCVGRLRGSLRYGVRYL